MYQWTAIYMTPNLGKDFTCKVQIHELYLFHQLAPVLCLMMSTQHKPSAAFVLIQYTQSPNPSHKNTCLVQQFHIAHAFLATLNKFYFTIKLNLHREAKKQQLNIYSGVRYLRLNLVLYQLLILNTILHLSVFYLPQLYSEDSDSFYFIGFCKN